MALKLDGLIRGRNGRYEVLKQIGEGGFARVFQARDRRDDRIVALKVLKEAVRGHNDVVERFRREALAVSSIDNCHIVKVFDFDLVGEELFIAMEYVEGLSLRDLVGEPFSADDIHVIAGQVSQAVAAAHCKNIVHRDLKPDNIMLVGQGGQRSVKVLDFGFAKLAELEQQLGLEPLTQAGLCFGTPPYMAPEQIQGHRIGPMADLYALGVILYEMASGHVPFDGSEAREVFMAVLRNPVPALGKLHPTITRPDGLEAFFERALAKSPAERFPDAETLFRALAAAVVARPPPKTAPAFSSIIGKTISLKEILLEDTFVDASPFSERGSVDSMTMPGVRNAASRRRLHSGWQPSLTDLPTVSSADADPPTLPNGSVPPGVTRPKSAPVERRSMTELVPAPRNHRGWWIVLLVVALIVVAAAVGYYAGSRRA